MKTKAIILRNELNGDHEPWLRACEDYKERIEYRVVNLTLSNWLEEVQREPFDILLAKPGGLTAPFKQLFDERIYILGVVLGYKIFPSPQEIFIYENKRMLSYWLKANKIPHPTTDVLYNLEEAIQYLDKCSYPIVAKTSIGASGSGVYILKSRKEGKAYAIRAFSSKGAPRRSGPNFEKGGIFRRGLHYLVHPKEIRNKLRIYKAIGADLQVDFVIFQEYVQHDFEWRAVRIGDSFFAHKKIKKVEKASGSLLKLYGNPPYELLDFIKEITDKYSFFSQAIDIFESERGYLVNEIQCIFGQSDPYQMIINGKPGRYRYLDNSWVFEEGDFARNGCYNLRVGFVMSEFLSRE